MFVAIDAVHFFGLLMLLITIGALLMVLFLKPMEDSIEDTVRTDNVRREDARDLLKL